MTARFGRDVTDYALGIGLQPHKTRSWRLPSGRWLGDATLLVDARGAPEDTIAASNAGANAFAAGRCVRTNWLG